ncbi:MAG: hypothetical protein AAF721_12175 [Myxococcota bacterium]
MIRGVDGIAVAAAASLLVSSVAWAAPEPTVPEVGATEAGPEEPPVEAPAVEETPTEEGGSDDGATPEAPPDSEGEPGPTDVADAMLAKRVSDAAEHYDKGAALLSERRYPEAAAEFERSHAAIGFGDTLFKIVAAYDAANEPIRALEKAREYLALPTCDGDGREGAGNYPCGEPKQRDDVGRRADRLRRLVGELKLKLDDDVVVREVKVADAVVPLSDFPLLVSPGSFVVWLTGAKKGQRRSIPVEVDAGETYTIFVPSFETSAPPDGGTTDNGIGDAVEDPRFDPVRRRRVLRGVFWGGVGATALSGVALGVLAGLWSSNTRRFNELHCSGECPMDIYDALPEDPATPEGVKYPLSFEQAANRFEVARNAMIGVTAGLGVVTVVLGIFAYSKKPTRTNARLQVRAGGLAVRW